MLLRDDETRRRIYIALYKAIREDLEERVKAGEFVKELEAEDDEAVWEFYDVVLADLRGPLSDAIVDAVCDVRYDFCGCPEEEEDFWFENGEDYWK